MRRRFLVASLLLGMLAGCGALIGVDETYAGPAGEGDGGVTGDGSLVTTSTSSDASSIPISAPPVPFPCDAGADAGAWSLDCAFGVAGSVTLAADALEAAPLSLGVNHLYAAIPLASGAPTGFISIVAVLADGGEPRELVRLAGTNLRDVRSVETVSTATETLAYVYAYLGASTGPPQLYDVLWSREETSSVSDKILPGILQAVPADGGVGEPIALAHAGSIFSDLELVASGTDAGPALLDVGYAADQVVSVKQNLNLRPLASVTAVEPYPDEDNTVFWAAGPSVHDDVVADIVGSNESIVAYAQLDFVPTALAAIDESDVFALGSVVGDAGGALTAPFAAMAHTSVVANDRGVAASGQAQVSIVVEGSLPLPFSTPPASIRVVARGYVTGAPPPALVTVAAIAPAMESTGASLVMARYVVNPDGPLDASAALFQDDGAQVTGTATATIDSTFGVQGTLTVPLGYPDVELGALRMSTVDKGYYVTLRVTLADGTRPTMLIHVRETTS